MAGDDVTGSMHTIGPLLRAARGRRGLSIEAVAARAGVSVGTVSQYERGMGNPTMETLRRLAKALDVPFVGLTMGTLDDGRTGAGSPPRPGRIGIVRRDERRRLVLPGVGPEYDILSPDLGGSLLLMHSVFRVGFDNVDQPFAHEGEEAVTLVSGRVQGRIGDATVDLEAGDTVTFDAALPHGWRTLGDQDAVFYSAMTPPTLF